MGLQAGCAEVDITPPVGTRIIGWLKCIQSQRVLDPLYGKAVVLSSDTGQVGFVGLDTLSIRWTTTQQIRRRIEELCGFPGDHVMVCATHSHAGPAMSNCGEADREDAYVAGLVEQVAQTFAKAVESRQPAELAFGHGFEFEVTRNRRVLMRNGTVKTHGKFDTPDALTIEGPIDPELAVIALRTQAGQPLGVLVNYACHPTHHGSDGCFSAGFPGQLAEQLRQQGWPVCLYLQGAAGNLHYSDPRPGRPTLSKEAIGERLAGDVVGLCEQLEWQPDVRLEARQANVVLPYRRPAESEIKGVIRGAQRFVDPLIYDRLMDGLLRRIDERKVQPAELQALCLDDHVVVSIPAEYFCELGLRIKQRTYPLRTLVAGYANGMVGYVPHREAFEHGGYETTFAPSSRMAPEAGDILADAAIDLVNDWSLVG